MRKLTLRGAITIWLACSFITFGILNADSKWKSICSWPSLEYSQRDDIGFIVAESAMGPFGLVSMTVMTNFWHRGWSLKTWDSRNFTCVDGLAVPK